MGRGRMSDHIIMRMAEEGIPINAMCRILIENREDVTSVVERALKLGTLKSRPADEWSQPRRREANQTRVPTTEIQHLADRIHGFMHLRPRPALFLAALVVMGTVGRSTMHTLVTTSGDIRTVDVYAWHVRKVLKEKRIGFERLWGRGYLMSDRDRAMVRSIVEQAEASIAIKRRRLTHAA